MEIIDFIGDSDKLVAELGEWPSFHDDEVVAVLLKRGTDFDPEVNSSLRLSIHVRRHEQIGLGTAQYHLKMNKNILVHLIFLDIQDLAISDFNGQNVIHSIAITVDSKSHTLDASVKIESSWGLRGTFRCKSIRVESLEMLPIEDDN